ncbi:MAG: DUF4340 domain-containing protein [Pseudomonadota bacterium]
MTESTLIRRRRIVWTLATLAAILLSIVLLQRPRDPDYRLTERAGQSVFPRLARQIDAVQIIRVTASDLSYTMKRSPADPQQWTMIESGSFPIRADRLGELAQGVLSLAWGETRTEDPAKLDRIGLGSPENGGNGARIDMMDTDGDVLASLVTGRKGDRLYGRFPDESRAFLLSGDLPPLYTRQSWLDLNVLEMQEDAIGAIRITDRAGRGVYLARPPGSGARAFRPAPPYEDWRMVSAIAARGPALALSRFDPIDVKPATAIETRRIGRHITTTHDGLEIDVSAYEEPDGLYVTVRAVEAGEGAARASTINKRAEGWAFRLAKIDWDEFTPSVRSIVRPPPPPADSPSP